MFLLDQIKNLLAIAGDISPRARVASLEGLAKMTERGAGLVGKALILAIARPSRLNTVEASLVISKQHIAL